MTSSEKLNKVDLIVDAVYAGDSGSLSEEPISKLLGVGNSGGYRPLGQGKDKKYVVLFSKEDCEQWPNKFEPSTGQFDFFGPIGARGYNHFKYINTIGPTELKKVPPYFIFKHCPTSKSERSVRFIGLAAPEFCGYSGDSHLAKRQISGVVRYQATFRVLNIQKIKRVWIDDLATNGPPSDDKAPAVWSDWVRAGHYNALSTENNSHS